MTGEQDQDPLVGSKVGPCRIEKRLAAGGMGVVYRARHLPTDREVAVKMLAPSLAADEEYVTRFFGEAGAAGQIDHPNVVRVLDVGRHENTYYLVMQFVAGETLDDILHAERKLSLEKATRIIHDIAAGLAAAHRAGIIHRDVKPGNIIISHDGSPHLTDFGLARMAKPGKGLTVEGTFLGTPEYASPEQVEGRKLDHRTDLYSLGVTYFQILSGALPFLGQSPMEIAIKRTKEPARPLEQVLADADPRACAIVARLLEQEPVRRFQSATDLIRDLDVILTGRELKGDTAARTAAEKKPAMSIEAKRALLSIIHGDMVATAVALAFFSGVLADRGRFLETWGAGDGFSTRVILLAVAGLLAVAAIFVYREPLRASGRMWVHGPALGLMLFGGLGAGAALDFSDGGSGASRLQGAVRALADHMRERPGLLAVGMFSFFVSAVVSFERQAGTMRVLLCRAGMLVFFGMAYAAGAVDAGIVAPLKGMAANAEFSLPLATGALLACVFGAMMVTSYNFEVPAKTAGLLLSLAGAAGVYAFSVTASQSGKGSSPGDALWHSVAGLPGKPAGSGVLLAAVAAAGFLSQRIVAAGIRKRERSFRSR